MKKLGRKACLGALLLSLVVLPAQAGKDLSKLRATLEAMSDDLVRATLEGDVETVMSYYTDDCVSMPNYQGILDGAQEIRAYQENMREQGVEFHSMEFDMLDLWTCGKLVYETGTYGVSVTAPGTPGAVSDHGEYLTVWERQRSGELKIKKEIWNSDLNPWDVAGLQDRSPGAGTECRQLVEAKNTLHEMVGNLRKRGYIGLDGAWDEEAGGYRVSGFSDGTAAVEAGVRVGDLLTRINGIPMTDFDASRADEVNRRPGRKVEITLLRDGVEHAMTVTLMSATEKMIAEEIGSYVLNRYLD